MRIYCSPNHRLRDAASELHGGRLVKPFESPSRVELILEQLRERGLDDIVEPEDFGLNPASRIHDRNYLDFLATVWRRWRALHHDGEAIATCFPARRMRTDRLPSDVEAQMGYYAFAADTSITEGSFSAAISSMHCAVSGAKTVINGASAAFALCRPPGHHASLDQFGGYCFLNNAAIAAQYCLDHGSTRVAVVDIDFHHGNGTQDLFYNRKDVVFASIHGDPSEAFPHFLGYGDELGAGDGEGANLNYPLPRGTHYDAWSSALAEALHKCIRQGAEILVVSLGVDTFERDPISFFKLTSDDFLRVGALISGTGLPTLFCMEGGYAVEEIGLNTVNVLAGFLQR